MHHKFVWDGLCMARTEMCAGFQEILYFINITCRNYQLGAAVGLGPVVMGLITFWLSLGLKSQKSVVHSAGGTLHLSTLMSAATLCSVPVVPSPCWPWDNNIKQGMHWLLLLFFFPSPLPILFNCDGCEQPRRVHKVNKLGIPTPFVSASPGTRLLALLRGLEPRNPSWPTAPRPPSSQGQPQQGTAPGWGAQIFGDETKCFRCDELDICFIRGEKKGKINQL